MEVLKYKMMYKISKHKNNIRILGNEFIKSNRNKGKLIINNKKQYFREFFHFENNNEKQLNIKMILSNDIYNVNINISNNIDNSVNNNFNNNSNNNSNGSNSNKNSVEEDMKNEI